MWRVRGLELPTPGTEISTATHFEQTVEVSDWDRLLVDGQSDHESYEDSQVRPRRKFCVLGRGHRLEAVIDYACVTSIPCCVGASVFREMDSNIHFMDADPSKSVLKQSLYQLFRRIVGTGTARYVELFCS